MADSKVVLNIRFDFTQLQAQIRDFQVALWGLQPPQPGAADYDDWLVWLAAQPKETNG